jgi:hypothetical protein
MIRVFASGSCRILSSIHLLPELDSNINVLNSLESNFHGTNFIGKLHNVKQHIQFIRLLRNEIHIPDHIMNLFLTMLSTKDRLTSLFRYFTLYKILPDVPTLEILKSKFAECDVYVFEICSIIDYVMEGYQVQNELLTEYNVSATRLTQDDLEDDIEELLSLIPSGKSVIFQCHFRNGGKSRESIYNALIKIKEKYPHITVYDPTFISRSDCNMYDDKHFNGNGRLLNAKNLLELIKEFRQSR